MASQFVPKFRSSDTKHYHRSHSSTGTSSHSNTIKNVNCSPTSPNPQLLKIAKQRQESKARKTIRRSTSLSLKELSSLHTLTSNSETLSINNSEDSSPPQHPLLNQAHPAFPTTALTRSSPLEKLTSTFPHPKPILRRSPHQHCTACTSALPNALTAYSFPATAPLVLCTVSKIYNHSLTPPLPSPNKPLRLPFCRPCFTHLHAMHLCWACGTEIFRPEERVGCGWAWWHWGCFCCLLCRAPVKPPRWKGREMRIEGEEGVACGRCRREVGVMVM